MCRIDHAKDDSRSQSSEGELFPKTTAKYQLARLKNCSHLQNLFSTASSLPKVFFSAIHSATTKKSSLHKQNSSFKLVPTSVVKTLDWHNASLFTSYHKQHSYSDVYLLIITIDITKKSVCPRHGAVGLLSEHWRGWGRRIAHLDT